MQHAVDLQQVERLRQRQPPPGLALLPGCGSGTKRFELSALSLCAKGLKLSALLLAKSLEGSNAPRPVSAAAWALGGLELFGFLDRHGYSSVCASGMLVVTRWRRLRVPCRHDCRALNTCCVKRRLSAQNSRRRLHPPATTGSQSLWVVLLVR